MIPPVPVSRLLLLGLVAAGAIAAIATPQPTSSFAGGFAAAEGNPKRSPPRLRLRSNARRSPHPRRCP